MNLAKVAKTSLTLWGFPGSSTTNRVRMALAIKGIAFEMKFVDFSKNVQRSEEYKTKYNPMAQIPILEIIGSGSDDDDDDKKPSPVMLKQSVAIMEYLDEAYPNTPNLLPDDPIERAKCRELVEICNSFIQPMQNKITVEKVAENDKELAAMLTDFVTAHLKGIKHELGDGQTRPNLWPQQFINQGFRAFESIISTDGMAGKYCMGNTLTMADCVLVPQVIGAKKYHVDMEQYPTISRVYNNIINVPAISEVLGDVLPSVEDV